MDTKELFGKSTDNRFLTSGDRIIYLVHDGLTCIRAGILPMDILFSVHATASTGGPLRYLVL